MTQHAPPTDPIGAPGLQAEAGQLLPVTTPDPGAHNNGEQAVRPFAQPIAVCPRDPAVHLLVSMFLPGVGTMMTGAEGRGAALLVGYLGSWLVSLAAVAYVATTFASVVLAGHVDTWLVPLVLVRHLVTGVPAPTLIGPPCVLAFWVTAMIDAYTDARAWNRRHGIVS